MRSTQSAVGGSHGGRPSVIDSRFDSTCMGVVAVSPAGDASWVEEAAKKTRPIAIGRVFAVEDETIAEPYRDRPEAQRDSSVEPGEAANR